MRKSYPKVVVGAFSGRGPVQYFARTQGYVVDGMCGGPVLLSAPHLKRNSVCGMLEGIVPSNHPIPQLQGLAAFINSREIATFIAKVEAGSEDIIRLEGGEALRTVAEQEDPGNLTLDGMEKRCKDLERAKGKGVSGDFYQ